MALHIDSMKRVFKYKKIILTDPNPKLTPEEVQNFYSSSYPELTTGKIEGPEIKDGEAVYTLSSRIGTKG